MTQTFTAGGGWAVRGGDGAGRARGEGGVGLLERLRSITPAGSNYIKNKSKTESSKRGVRVGNKASQRVIAGGYVRILD